jgi:hypothetical protein
MGMEIGHINTKCTKTITIFGALAPGTVLGRGFGPVVRQNAE